MKFLVAHEGRNLGLVTHSKPPVDDLLFHLHVPPGGGKRGIQRRVALGRHIGHYTRPTTAWSESRTPIPRAPQ